ncbi:MAG: biopolymer transporter ExbD [Chitinivibrionia bacterium]|nr:biopolymer transporter ExbD [Chitinivibrionia bacterium]
MKRKSLLGKSRQESGDSGITSPQLTSLIDVMTVLLIFLIQNFSAQGDFINTQPDISLPRSEITTTPLPTLMVQISENEVRVQGIFVVRNASFANAADLKIPELYEVLSKNREERIENRIIIEADKNLPFNIIKRVSFTSNAAGFEDFEILVNREQ